MAHEVPEHKMRMRLIIPALGFLSITQTKGRHLHKAGKPQGSEPQAPLETEWGAPESLRYCNGIGAGRRLFQVPKDALYFFWLFRVLAQLKGRQFWFTNS